MVENAKKKIIEMLLTKLWRRIAFGEIIYLGREMHMKKCMRDMCWWQHKMFTMQLFWASFQLEIHINFLPYMRVIQPMRNEANNSHVTNEKCFFLGISTIVTVV